MTTPAAPAPAAPTVRITLERSYQAPVEAVWDRWTTKAGIESWWGPEGFTVTVSQLDLRPGGELHYAMTATGPEQIAFMRQAGMPVTTDARLTYSEVARYQRLAYEHLVDFVPDHAPYTVATVVELRPTATGVTVVLTFDAMHDELWTQRATMGWESELGKLAAALAA